MTLNRAHLLQSLRERPAVDVLIIGAGINGIGTYRDLALQGVDVLLVDKADFASGASAASSHMAHGGLRYLENAEFRLVREALHERNRLLANAPHAVFPLPTTIPIYNWLSGALNAPLKFLGLRDKPGERGAFVIKIGLTLYDLFTRDSQAMPGHQFFGRAESLAKRPALNPNILCTATYYDAWMPCPERICIELLTDTDAAAPSARAIAYLAAEAAAGDTVTLRDVETGETYPVQPKLVINAAGPWIDFVNSALGRQTQFIGGTKGSHLVLDHPELHALCAGHELFFENEDGRITLFFPLGGKVLAGTTDIAIDDPEQARTTDAEIDYILAAVRRVFPSIQLDRSHIVFHFTGVRPLPNSKASTTGQISRDHSIEEAPAGRGLHFPIYSLVGGKWTTFRAFSEQTADRALRFLNRARKTSTAHLPIGGGRDYPRIDRDRRAWVEALAAETGLTRDRAETLFGRYGTQAAAVARFCAAGADAPLTHRPDYSRREIAWLAENEQITHLDDLLLRRSLLAMLGQVDGESLAELAAALGDALGWSEATVAAEVTRAADILRAHHGVSVRVTV